MFLLKQYFRDGQADPETPLHSTMFLLKPAEIASDLAVLASLHSTMFLLKPDYVYRDIQVRSFTFHNVSIKTFLSAFSDPHSLFLYIPQCFY